LREIAGKHVFTCFFNVLCSAKELQSFPYVPRNFKYLARFTADSAACSRNFPGITRPGGLAFPRFPRSRQCAAGPSASWRHRQAAWTNSGLNDRPFSAGRRSSLNDRKVGGSGPSPSSRHPSECWGLRRNCASSPEMPAFAGMTGMSARPERPFPNEKPQRLAWGNLSTRSGACFQRDRIGDRSTTS